VSDPIEASALHYTASELDRGVHPYELTESSETILRLNAVQMGVGGDNSWFRDIVHEPYLLHEESYEYTFVLSPLQALEDPADYSMELKTLLQELLPEES
ncbi:MAG: hypothetical protein HUJ76_10195, partial [Parasporobacterium sp.]|nr:hypothetical protein [Parasporobacterium sp.]